MFIDARNLTENTLIEQDICIIGAGAAGITFAREFFNTSYQVCLLESGGFNHEEATQSLYAGENIGVPYFPLKEARARYLGGSTNLWGGWSRPLDEIDFAPHPWMPYSGWPFGREELMPYYQRAQEVSHLGPCEYDYAYWRQALAQAQRAELPFLSDNLISCIWQIIPPEYVRFAQVYRSQLEQASNIKTILHANVLEIQTSHSTKKVTKLRVATPEGKQFWVAAKVFILAAGGIENPRLLLVSNQVQTNGLGNQYDLVGRFFMEHPYLVSGKLRLSNPAPLYTQRHFRLGEMYMGTALGLSPAAQEREQILNFCSRLIPLEEEWFKALRRLRSLKNLPRGKSKMHQAFPSIKEGRHNTYSDRQSVLADVSTVLTHLDRLAVRGYQKLFDKKAFKAPPNFCETHLIGEQAPNPDSRITLSRERDRLGLQRIQLDWRLTPLDKYTMTRAQQLIAQEFERAGLGKLEIELSDDDSAWQALRGSYHHIGTTRMSNNPHQGVVDEHCQVHGISNLYIAGSSVFPTSGLSNPTLTIVALTIRLAEHIQQRLSAAEVTTIPTAASNQVAVS
jgi:choline dehydrogenase-like flavoprotein